MILKQNSNQIQAEEPTGTFTFSQVAASSNQIMQVPRSLVYMWGPQGSTCAQQRCLLVREDAFYRF